jgi:UDP-N-acetylglucosamine 4-epimerase
MNGKRSLSDSPGGAVFRSLALGELHLLSKNPSDFPPNSTSLSLTNKRMTKQAYTKLSNKKILITGCAGFIGSNLLEDMLKSGNMVVGLDDFSTGFRHNIEEFLTDPNFSFIEGDIRNLETCQKACSGVEVIFHQAALGSVPRSLNDPINTNSVNIDGFLNMLVAARDNNVERFVYAASSSTYGDSEKLPKVEDQIGMPLSPYAVTKYVNELYAHVFGLNYGLKCIGLRYFNVYGKRQTPDGAYAAVIPKFVDLLLKGKAPVINGDGTNSRDFTYIANVVQMNHLAATTTNEKAFGQIFNTAVGDRSDLNMLITELKACLSEYQADVANITPTHGPTRQGDIPHSLASIEKAKNILGYEPSHDLKNGLKEAVDWYYKKA